MISIVKYLNEGFLSDVYNNNIKKYVDQATERPTFMKPKYNERKSRNDDFDKMLKGAFKKSGEQRVRVVNEGILDTLNNKLVNSKFGKTVDNINDKIDKSLQKTAPGRAYMGFENKITNSVNKAGDKLSNLNDQLHRRNYKVR